MMDPLMTENGKPRTIESFAAGLEWHRHYDTDQNISLNSLERDDLLAVLHQAMAMKAVVLRFLREVSPDHISRDLYEHAQAVEHGIRCAACRGRGLVERCCGEGIPATYWQPSECCGREVEEDCETCHGSGYVHPDDVSAALQHSREGGGT